MSRLGQSGDARKRNDDGNLDLRVLISRPLVKTLNGCCNIVTASIVPVGIGDAIEESLAVRLPRATFVSSNPEFLREGHAMASSILTGSSSLEFEGPRARMAQFYTPRVQGGALRIPTGARPRRRRPPRGKRGFVAEPRQTQQRRSGLNSPNAEGPQLLWVGTKRYSLCATDKCFGTHTIEASIMT